MRLLKLFGSILVFMTVSYSFSTNASAESYLEFSESSFTDQIKTEFDQLYLGALDRGKEAFGIVGDLNKSELGVGIAFYRIANDQSLEQVGYTFPLNLEGKTVANIKAIPGEIGSQIIDVNSSSDLTQQIEAAVQQASSGDHLKYLEDERYQARGFYLQHGEEESFIDINKGSIYPMHQLYEFADTVRTQRSQIQQKNSYGSDVIQAGGGAIDSTASYTNSVSRLILTTVTLLLGAAGGIIFWKMRKKRSR